MKLRTLILFGILLILCLAHWWCALSDKFIAVVSALGEWGIVAVIFWEWESSRFDHFLEDADPKSTGDARKKIYDAYCGLAAPPGKIRNELFKSELEKPGNEALRDICHDHSRLMSRIGARLPFSPSFKSRALEWHVPVFLWEILGHYILSRRNDSGPSYAESFLEYALASVNRLLKQKGRNTWTIHDPNVPRKQDVVLTRDYLMKMKMGLIAELKRPG